MDVGGSVFIHTFGAYFGLAVARRIGGGEDQQDNTVSYDSNLFSMVGTVFLWMYWPSFNAVLAPTQFFAKERVVINTIISLTGSCMAAFCASSVMDPNKRFNMTDIQNATLAGGVAIGASANLVIGLWGALLIGLIAGTLSVWGYQYLQTKLQTKFDVYDTCGVNNLHGMPGILGGLAIAFAALTAVECNYGDCTDDRNCFARGDGENWEHMTAFFPKASSQTTPDSGNIPDSNCWAFDRGMAFVYQFCGLLITLAMAIIGGTLVGFLLLKIDKQDSDFHDKFAWGLPNGVLEFWGEGDNGNDSKAGQSTSSNWETPDEASPQNIVDMDMLEQPLISE